MRNSYLLYLALKRISFKKIRSIIIAIPLICTVALFVAITNWTFNLQAKIQAELIEPAKQQQTLLTVENSQSGQAAGFLSNSQLFKPITQQQVSSIRAIPGVKHTSAVRNVPYASFINIDDMPVKGASSVITSLNESVAHLFGVDDFSYTPGQPIPIIIGQGAFTESYIDFAGKQTIEITVRGDQETSADRNARPIKTVLHRDLMNTNVVGLRGKLTIPLMPSQPQYTFNQIQREGEYIDIYSHVTPDQLSQYDAATTSVWKKYWDVNTLQEPLSIPVVVVGINKSNAQTNSYVPHDAAMYISQLTRDRYEFARNKEDIPNTILKYSLGILLPDNTFKLWPSGYLTNIPDVRTLDSPSQLPILSRYISGKDDSILLQELRHVEFTEDNLITSTYIVEVDSQADIREASSKISNLGLVSYSDWTSGVYGEIMGLVAPFILIALGLAILISIISISILAWAYTSDSTREIGILRSLGITSAHSKIYITLQLALIAAVAVVVGIGFGLLLNTICASAILSALDTQSAITRSLAAYNVVLNPADISRLHFELLIPIGIISILVPLLFGVIAALKGLHTNPMQAIRNANE